MTKPVIFTPDYCVNPGEILQERLQAVGMHEAEFAERSQISMKTVNQIIHAKAPLTPQHALQFERVLNVPAQVWINLEAQYRQFLAQQPEDTSRSPGSIS